MQNNAERGGAAAAVRRGLDGGVRDQLVRGGVGAGRRLRVRRVGQHHQLRAAGVHLRPLRQVLPVPFPCSARSQPPELNAGALAPAPASRPLLPSRVRPRGLAPVPAMASGPLPNGAHCPERRKKETKMKKISKINN